VPAELASDCEAGAAVGSAAGISVCEAEAESFCRTRYAATPAMTGTAIKLTVTIRLCFMVLIDLRVETDFNNARHGPTSLEDAKNISE
jgi:hypothetical protein